MTLITQIFEPSNIMRYVTVYSKDGRTELNVEWNSIFNMILLNKIPLHLELFKNACISAIQKHICEVFKVPRNKPNAIKTMPYMVALVIFEVAKIMIIEDSKPSVDGDTGDESVPENLKVSGEEIQKKDGKLIISPLK